MGERRIAVGFTQPRSVLIFSSPGQSSCLSITQLGSSPARCGGSHPASSAPLNVSG
jgi:hypothetical protein